MPPYAVLTPTYTRENPQQVLAETQRRAWTLVDSQVRVRVGAKCTAMDLLARCGAAWVVLELKTVWSGAVTHTAHYKTVDPARRRTRSGYLNSQYWRHQAQVIDTARMFRAHPAAGPCAVIKSAVIVSTRECVFVYPTRQPGKQ